MGTHSGKRLFSNFVALSIIQGTNFLLPLLVMPFVIKRIGADGFGVISVAQVFMIYLSTFADYGFNLTATRDISVNRNDRNKVSRIFYTVITTKLLITVLSFFALLIVIASVPLLKGYFLLYLLGFTYVIGQSMMTTWLFQGMEKMQYITVISLIARLIFVMLVFAFIRERADKQYFLFFLGIGNIIAGIISIYLSIRIFRIPFFRPAWSDIKYELKEGWQVTLTNLSINTSQYINIFLLRIFTNDLIVGYYSIAEKVFLAIRQILSVYAQAIYPRVSQLILQEKENVVLFFKKIYLPFLLLVIGGCCIVYMFSPLIIYILLGQQLSSPVLLLRILSVVPVIVCLNIPAYQVLIVLNQKKSYLRIFISGTIINVVANLLLVNIWGPVGTALSIIITELFITIALNAAVYKKYYRHRTYFNKSNQ